MSDDDEIGGLTPRDTFQILENTVHGLHRQIADMIALKAQVEGLELMVVAMGKKLGWAPEDLVAKMREVQNTIHQARLEIVENRNPGAAAMADNRQAMPEIDHKLLGLLEFDGLDEGDKS